VLELLVIIAGLVLSLLLLAPLALAVVAMVTRGRNPRGAVTPLHDGPLDPDAAESRPWEEPGAVRRDVEPHRGNLLLLLARVALVLAACSFCLAPAVLAAAPLAGAAYALACRDLGRMEVGDLDPAGRPTTEQARLFAAWALALGMIGALSCMMAFMTLGPMAVDFRAATTRPRADPAGGDRRRTGRAEAPGR
jgi:hypothetical protein